MRIRLDEVLDRNAISCVCADDVEQGQILKIEGLAEIALAGECYQVAKAENDKEELFVVVAHDGHCYSDEEYNFADKATIKAGEPFRAYILEGFQVVTVEKEVAPVAKGNKVGADAEGKWAVVSEGVVGKVLAEVKLADRDAVQILIVR